MTRDEMVNMLAERRDTLARLGVRSLALFGSVAREEAGPESDVDLLVDFDDHRLLFHRPRSSRTANRSWTFLPWGVLITSRPLKM